MSFSREFVLERVLLESRFKYSNMQINIEDPYVKHIKYLQHFFKQEHLAKDGIEKQHHITLLFGIKSNSKNLIKDSFFEVKTPPFFINVESIEVFRNETDVVVLKCSSPELIELRKHFEERLPFKRTHKDYKPHITLAYVKSGLGDKYKEFLDKKFVKGKIKVNHIYFSNQNGQTIRYKLG